MATLIYLNQRSDWICGPRKIGEIDESISARSKNKIGRDLANQVRIFSGVCREDPTECLIEIVENRSLTTL